MLISKISNAGSFRWILTLSLVTVGGCTSLNFSKSGRQNTAELDSSKTPNMPVDPWSLGPDVFAQALPDFVPEVKQDELPLPDSLSSQPERAPQIDVPDAPTEVISKGAARRDSVFTVQLGTFLDQDKAEELNSKASATLGLQGVVHSDWPFFRLRFGAFVSRDAADSLHRVAMSRGFYDARVLKTLADN